MELWLWTYELRYDESSITKGNAFSKMCISANNGTPSIVGLIFFLVEEMEEDVKWTYKLS